MSVILNPVKQDKQQQRLRHKEIRRSIRNEVKADYDSAIFEKIIKSTPYLNSDILLTYVSSEIEVDTLRLISYSLHNGKAVAVPKCRTGCCEIDFYRIQSLNDLKSCSYSIMEPDAVEENRVSYFKDSLCIVPALALDIHGYRLGYGKGYYDRFLSAHKDIISIGLCYDENFVERLATEFFDVNVKYIITEKHFMEAYDEK